MSFESRIKIRPIDECGIKSIENEIALHKRKKERAEKFGDEKSANFHKKRIKKLQEKLDSRKAITNT